MYSTVNAFTNWLIEEMNKRGWSQAELARRAGISRGAVANLINGQRKPGPETCEGIARAFRYPADKVFQLAGLLPESGDNEDPRLARLNRMMAQLPADDQDDIIAMVEAYIERREKGTRGSTTSQRLAEVE